MNFYKYYLALNSGQSAETSFASTIDNNAR